MGIPVLVLGESGSGKSSSLRNFKSGEIGLFNVASKPLPFRTDLKKLDTSNYEQIKNKIKEGKVKTYVIDDSQYLMAFESFRKVHDVGYSKFTEMALNFYNLVKTIIDETPEDTIVYLLHHVERADDGHVKAKTVGKMLDSQLVLEGLFSIVLMASTDGQKYVFETKNNGVNTVKTPMGMFDKKEIDNDLKLVDKTIREYYGLCSKAE